MPGQRITDRQYEVYMKLRPQFTQGIAAAKAGFSQSTASLLDHRGREQACARPPAQIPACALTHGAPASDDDERPLVRPRALKPVAETRETPTWSRHRKCVLHCLVGSAEWSFPPTVGICRPGDTNGGYPCWVNGTRY